METVDQAMPMTTHHPWPPSHWRPYPIPTDILQTSVHQLFSHGWRPYQEALSCKIPPVCWTNLCLDGVQQPQTQATEKAWLSSEVPISKICEGRISSYQSMHPPHSRHPGFGHNLWACIPALARHLWHQLDHLILTLVSGRIPQGPHGHI